MFKTATDGRNKYVDAGLTIERCYELADGWRDEAATPDIRDWFGFTVWDESPVEIGTKARWGDLLMSRIEADEVVYVQPRVGWAGVSLAYLAKKHRKKLTLFMPAAKQASKHQLVAIERGATPVFRRIAAMPNLNRLAKAYADERGAAFVPFGLDHELVVAGGVVSTIQQWGDRPAPSYVSTVVSTGVLTRTLQIVWPQAQFVGVAVARNMHDGECGRAAMESYHLPFTRDAVKADELWPTIHSARNYDMKGLEYAVDGLLELPCDSSTLLWNVAGEVTPEHLQPSDVLSDVPWERKPRVMIHEHGRDDEVLRLSGGGHQ
jgi:hypothetical protein